MNGWRILAQWDSEKAQTVLDGLASVLRGDPVAAAVYYAGYGGA